MNSPTFQDLELDNYQCPYFTPMLPNDVPDVVFHVHEQMMFRNNGVYFYLHVKDATKSQTLYSLYCLKPAQEPIKQCTLSRATEYHNVCNRVDVGGSNAAMSGRPLRWGRRELTCLIEGRIGHRIGHRIGSRMGIRDLCGRARRRDWAQVKSRGIPVPTVPCLHGRHGNCTVGMGIARLALGIAQ